MTHLDFAIDLAKQAGQLARKNFCLGMTKEWKSDDTPLTETDTAINRLVIEAIAKEFPGHAVMGEEESTTERAEYLWVCDPIDGTFPFSHAIPTFTFSLALVHQGQSILGVLYDPFMDRLLVAEKGQGTTLNGQSIQVSAATSLKNGLIDAECWVKATYDMSGINLLLDEAGAVPMTLLSTTYGSLLVASGQYIANIFAGTTPWDMAAVKVIVEEAGGRVTDLFGHDQPYDQPIKGAIVSNGKVHDQLIDIVARSLKERTV